MWPEDARTLSFPWATGTMPDATAAADPPLDPPAVEVRETPPVAGCASL